VSRAERVYTCFYLYQELGMHLHVSVPIGVVHAA
jgi:hypothetical protein